jgi:predicted nucleic acid-binding protein
VKCSKVFLDTNILIDFMIEDRPDGDAAAEVFDLASSGKLLCFTCGTSLINAYYITRKDLNDETRREWLRFFLDALGIANLDRKTCEQALLNGEPDFEDGCILAQAEACGADCIVSRDEQAFAGSSIPRLTAAELVATVRSEDAK